MKKTKKTQSPKFRQAMVSIHAVLDYLFRIVMLNLLIVVPALLPFFIYSKIAEAVDYVPEWVGYIAILPAAIYMFPAIVGAIDVFKMYQLDETKGVFKEFFKSFFKHFIKTFIVSIIVFLIFVFLFFNMEINGFMVQGPIFYFFNHLNELPSLFGLAITISFMIMGMYILIHLPLVMVYFDGLSLWHYIKLSFIMSFRNVLKTIIILLIEIAFIIFGLILPVEVFIIGVSLPLYFVVKLSFKDYVKIYRKVEENEKINN